MSEDKPVVGKVAFGPALSDEERKKRINETLARQDRRIELLKTQLSPPTPRPDVKRPEIDGLRLGARSFSISGKMVLLRDDVLSICDFIESLEVELKAADSLLVDLVEAVEKQRALQAKQIYIVKPTELDSIVALKAGDRVVAALTAAKQYLESGEKGKKR